MKRMLHIPFTIGLALIASSCAHPHPVAVESRYTTDMFVRAMDNSSTAPDFVLVTVVNAHNGRAQVVCTEAPFLEGALHMEYGIPYDETGERRVHELALKQSDCVFRLSNRKALRNVRPDYSQRQLDAVRLVIADRTDKDLLDRRFVNELYMGKNGNRDAVAHALLERGISCVRGCMIGDLYPHK